MYNLTDVIKSGKSDWEKMQKKVLKEAFSPEQSGHTATPSDTSPNAEIQGGKFDTTNKKIKIIKNNIDLLSNTPEYKEFRDKTHIAVSKEIKDKIINFIKTIKSATLSKDKNPAVFKQVQDTVTQNKKEMEKQVNEINQNIKIFNKWSDDAITRWTRGLGVQYRSFPTIENMNEFKDALNTFISGNSPHILQYLLPLVSSTLTESQLNEIKIRLGKPIAPKPVVNVGKDAGQGINAPNPETATEITQEFSGWLNGEHGIGMRNKMIESLTNIMNSVKNIEKIDAINQGYDSVIERFKHMSDIGKRGGEATASKRLVIKGLTPGDEKEIDATLNIPDEVVQTTKTGPGKVADLNSNPVETVQTEDDIKRQNIQNLNESWKKYSLKKTPNKQKPDDFVILMG